MINQSADHICTADNYNTAKCLSQVTLANTGDGVNLFVGRFLKVNFMDWYTMNSPIFSYLIKFSILCYTIVCPFWLWDSKIKMFVFYFVIWI